MLKLYKLEGGRGGGGIETDATDCFPYIKLDLKVEGRDFLLFLIVHLQLLWIISMLLLLFRTSVRPRTMLKVWNNVLVILGKQHGLGFNYFYVLFSRPPLNLKKAAKHKEMDWSNIL